VLDLIAKYGLARSTATTIVSKKRLLTELDLVRKRRYAVADGEAYSDLRALSVPIFDTDGEVRAAVSVNGQPSEPGWDDMPELVRIVEELCEISPAGPVSCGQFDPLPRNSRSVNASNKVGTESRR
jgi:DNA-binding IclR family transcriptional regulator